MSTKIIKCDCKSEFQDEQYGKGNRLHNIGGKFGEKAFCTVCSPRKPMITKEVAPMATLGIKYTLKADPSRIFKQVAR
jgi:hypothetical protein